MKNYFIVHGSFGSSKEHYIPWLKSKLEGADHEVFALDFPIGEEKQNYDAWCRVLDKYKSEINNDSIFIGRSIAPIFIIKYLLQNKINIKALFSISGFNGFINIPDYDKVNKTFFLKDLNGFEVLCEHRVCFLSDNDPYVPYCLLDEFSKNINAKVCLVKNAGHFNDESGYSTFEELLSEILKI